ncbi:MAG: hypothetical protein AAF943_18295 [Pseudomonadota bacterium]
MTHVSRCLIPFLLALLLVLPVAAKAADLSRFAGTYSGEAEFDLAGETIKRDLSTTIVETREGFEVSWTSVTYRPDGRTKEATYTIDFVPSARDNIFSSAMQTNLFGKAVPLDPLQGDPFVWARFEGETMTVFSLFIDEQGGYEMQEFHRTLVAEGLDLHFRRMRDGQVAREIKALLRRQ